jgi:hypothetical protein
MHPVMILLPIGEVEVKVEVAQFSTLFGDHVPQGSTPKGSW